jgi:hypothetical protein
MLAFVVLVFSSTVAYFGEKEGAFHTMRDSGETEGYEPSDEEAAQLDAQENGPDSGPAEISDEEAAKLDEQENGPDSGGCNHIYDFENPVTMARIRAELNINLTAPAARHSDSIRVYCYGLSGDYRRPLSEPHGRLRMYDLVGKQVTVDKGTTGAQEPKSETLPLFMRQLQLACDEYTIFAPFSFLPHIHKAYDPKDWLAISATSEQRILRDVLKRVVSKEGKALFDYVVKLDTDSYLRPSTFRQMLQRYDAAKPTVLSIGGQYGDLNKYDESTDGYFVALTRGVLERISSIQRFSAQRGCVEQSWCRQERAMEDRMSKAGIASKASQASSARDPISMTSFAKSVRRELQSMGVPAVGREESIAKGEVQKDCPCSFAPPSESMPAGEFVYFGDIVHDCSEMLTGDEWDARNIDEGGADRSVPAFLKPDGDSCKKRMGLKYDYPMDKEGYGMVIDNRPTVDEKDNVIPKTGFPTMEIAQKLKAGSYCFPPPKAKHLTRQVMWSRKGADCFSKHTAVIHGAKTANCYAQLMLELE